jgi:hypothetical protein
MITNQSDKNLVDLLFNSQKAVKIYLILVHLQPLNK